MTNKQTKKWILDWCDDEEKCPHNTFSWCTDGCGYDQHIKFVEHRNKNWAGGNKKEFLQFMRYYANNL